MQKAVSLAAIVFMVSALSACDLSTPSHVNTSKMRVMEDHVAYAFDVHTLSGATVERIARDVVLNGRSTMDLAVSYSSREDGKRVVASRSADAIKQEFKQRGVENVTVTLVPVESAQHTGQVVVSYQTLVAKPPKECIPLTGMDGAENVAGADTYEFGCETKSALSKMIADPSDLLGKASASEIESRRAGPTVERYKSGTPNEPMDGFTASDIGAR